MILMTDSELINLLETEPDRGYEMIIEQYGNLVYAIVLNKLKNVSSREDIEDCVSDIFVEIFRNAGKIDESRGSLKSFISTVAKRTAIDEFRKLLKSFSRTVAIDESNEDSIISDITPEQTSEEKSDKQLLWMKVKELGEPDNIILVQQFFYGKTAKEIGKLLSMTASTVQKRSVRARARLKKELAECGITY